MSVGFWQDHQLLLMYLLAHWKSCALLNGTNGSNFYLYAFIFADIVVGFFSCLNSKKRQDGSSDTKLKISASVFITFLKLICVVALVLVWLC